MSDDVYAYLSLNQVFKDHVRRQNRLAWSFSGLMVAVYFVFILVLAFRPEVLGRPLFPDSVITVGIPVGIAIILFAFLLTGIYVYIVNRHYDPVKLLLIEEAVNEI